MKRVTQQDCLHCGKEVSRKPKKYCDNTCQQAFETEALITAWLAGEDKGWSGITVQLKPAIRRYLLQLAGDKCRRCGWAEVHPITGHVPLEVDHVDGDAKNCRPTNLIVLCPNCHSLTGNFRNLNKNSSRSR
jgi:hypothetical protein